MRHRTYADNGTSATANNVYNATPLVRPCKMPQTSDTRNHLCRSIRSNGSGDLHPKTLPPDSKGRLNWPVFDEMRGPWVIEPPATPVNAIAARKRATPGAMMLIATPLTMWSTPKVTVANACNRPPRAPNTMAKNTPHHGPWR